MADDMDNSFSIKTKKARPEKNRRLAKKFLKMMKSMTNNGKGYGGKNRTSLGVSKFGSGVYVPNPAGSPQRVIVKSRYVKNKSQNAGKNLREHLDYIQRDGVAMDGGPAKAFSEDENMERDDVKKMSSKWEKDRHTFRFIISPEKGAEIDMDKFTKEYVAQMEKDLGTKLEWIACSHYNTDNTHVHLIVRGKDDQGKDLVINRDYISNGMRNRGQEIATNYLGPRTEIDVMKTLRREITQQRLTSLDRDIIRSAGPSRLYVLPPLSHSELGSMKRGATIQRLEHLESMGLVRQKFVGTWEISGDAEKTLSEMGKRGDIIKTMHERMKGLGRENIRDMVVLNPENMKKNSVVEKFTKLDEEIVKAAGPSRIYITEERSQNQFREQKRLETARRLDELERLGMAKKVLGGYEIASNLEKSLEEKNLALRLHDVSVKTRPVARDGGEEVDFPQVKGVVVDKGLTDELYDKKHLIIEGVDGRAYYVPVSDKIAESVGVGSYVEIDLATRQSSPAVDRNIENFSLDNDGVYDPEKFRLKVEVDRESGTLNIPETVTTNYYVEQHNARIENLASKGVIERLEDGTYRIPEKIAVVEQSQPAQQIAVKAPSHLTLETQIKAPGPTWIDREITTKGIDNGRPLTPIEKRIEEVKQRRLDELRSRGLIKEGEVKLSFESWNKLDELDRAAVQNKLVKHGQLISLEMKEGQATTFKGKAVALENLSSGPHVIVSNGKECIAVPSRSKFGFERQIGKGNEITVTQTDIRKGYSPAKFKIDVSKSLEINQGKQVGKGFGVLPGLSGRGGGLGF